MGLLMTLQIPCIGKHVPAHVTHYEDGKKSLLESGLRLGLEAWVTPPWVSENKQFLDRIKIKTYHKREQECHSWFLKAVALKKLICCCFEEKVSLAIDLYGCV